MPLYLDPQNNNEIIEVPANFDPNTGEDVERKALVEAGFVPAVEFVDPAQPSAERLVVPDAEIEQMRQANFMLPEEFQEETKKDQKFETTRIPIQSIKALAAKHGVSFEEADRMLELAGGLPAYRDADEAKYLAATGGELLLGIPQFLGKKTLSDSEERLFDDLRNLAQEHKSYLQAGLEIFAAPGFGAGKALAAGVKTGTAAGAALGAASGLGQSEQGTELTSAAIGAALGGGATLGLAGLGKGISKLVEKLDKKGLKASDELLKTSKNLEERIAAKREENAAAYAAVDSAYRAPDKMKLEEVKDILDWQKRRVKSEVGAEELKSLKPAEIVQHTLDFQALEVAKDLGWKIPKKPTRSSLKGKAKTAAAQKDAARRAKKAREFISEVEKQADGNLRIEAAQRRVRDRLIVAKELEADARKVVSWEDTGLLGKARDILSDGKFVARAIDNRLGTDLEGLLANGFAKNYTALSRYERIYADQVSSLRKEIKRMGLDETQFTDLAEQKALYNAATPEQKQLVDKAHNLFNTMREEVEKLGLPIRKFETEELFYVPNQTIGAIEAIPVIQKRVAELDKKLGKSLFRDTLEPDEYKKLLEDPSFKELVDSLNVLNRTNVKGPKAFHKQLNMAVTPGKGAFASQTVDTAASYAREGKIPDLIREKNFTKLAMRWNVQTFRAALFRESFDELQRIRDLAIASKDGRAARYVDNLLDDLTGMRKGTLVTWGARQKQKLQLRLYDQVQNSPNTSTRVLSKLFLDSTDMTHVFTTMPYASWLGGLNVKPLITNLSQTLTMTFPELGPVLADRTSPGVLGSLVKFMAKGETIVIKHPEVLKALQQSPKLNKMYGHLKVGDTVTTKNISLILANERLLGQSWNNEMLEAMREGLMTSAASSKIRGFIQQYSDAMLFAYQRTEWINRFIAYKSGQELGSLIQKGDKAALRYLGTEIPPSWRKKIIKMSNDGDLAGVQSEMANWLVDTTILNYNRAALSEYGRTMGPFFSMFTKWPTSISADLIDAYERQGFAKGTYRNFMKYGAPWTLLMLADTVASDITGEHRAKELFGTAGAQGMAPIGSAKSLATGELFNAPALQLITEFGGAVGTADPQRIARYLDRQIMTYIPGPVLLEQLTGDIPALIYDIPKKSLLPLSSKGEQSRGLKDIIEP